MPFISRPEISDRLNTLAITPLTSTPDELEKFIPAEIAKWAKVVKDAGIRAAVIERILPTARQ
jgi:tripartite-type tricarboxylate transporter receptor subunit TctC